MKVITISSFKGGTAKTSSALHIGAALAKFHKEKILLIDFDAQANLTAGLGFDPDTYDSLAPVLQGKKEIEEVILETNIKNLFLIPADTWLERVEVTEALAGDRYSHERLKRLLQKLEGFDTILIDTPPSLCWLTESALIASEYALISATPEFYSIKGLQRLSDFMKNISERHHLTVLGVLLSFWNPRGKSNEAFLEIVEGTFPGKILDNKVRRDISISEASIFGKSIFQTAPKSRAAQDYTGVAKELLVRLKKMSAVKTKGAL